MMLKALPHMPEKFLKKILRIKNKFLQERTLNTTGDGNLRICSSTMVFLRRGEDDY
jgi:hypothetical protein